MKTNERVKKSRHLSRRIRNMTAIPLFLSLIGCALAAGETKGAQDLKIECDTFSYVIDSTGRNLRFTDKAAGKDYCKSPAEGEWQYCASVKKGGKNFSVSSVSLKDHVLGLAFSGAGVTASVRVHDQKDRVVLEILDVTGDPDSLTFLNIPLTLEGRPSEPFAACALSLNLFTHVHQLPALHSELWATCYKRFGFKGGRVALIGVPQKQILPVIREVMKGASPDVPFCDQGGAWALSAKEGHGSYLMNFGSLTEATVGEWIENCKRLGFDQIDNHGGDPGFFLFGSMEMDKKKFPEGWQSYKKIVDRLHQAGISSILHTYACYIGPKSKYVTPVPHPGLDLTASFTLAAPLSPAATEIVVKEPTANAMGRDTTLRIGDEIIQFKGVTKQAPYTFTGCQRGFHGTAVTAHAAGEKAGILKTFWGGLYVPNPDSPLFDEIAKNTADVVNECGFDGIYLDAIEGIQYMWGKENYWYYGGRFVFAIAKHLKKPVGMEFAGMMHSWWHYRSRYQAWDSAARGYKRFLDIHIASMNAGEEYQHGAWRGHRPKIEKYAPMESCALYLPFQLGWWKLRTWGGTHSEPCLSDDIEYVCCKMIGHNAGLSLNCDVGEATLNRHPVYRDYLAMIKQYEELRHQNYFDDSVRRQLRQVGKDFTLFREKGGKWNFRPVAYNEHKVCGIDHPSAQWEVRSEYADQPVKLRLEPLLSVGAVTSPAAFLLLDPKSPGDVKTVRTAQGVTCSMRPGSVAVPATGEPALEVTAVSTGVAPQEGTWAALRRTFASPVNLLDREAIGVWIHGDGNGELLDFRVSGSHHYVTVDFKGWKYHELVEAESTLTSDYIWPDGNVYSYYTDWGHKGYGTAQSFELWLNNLPADKKVACLVGPVRALSHISKKIRNPTLAVNGAKTTFPVDLESGMYLELKAKGDCKLYSREGKMLQEVAVANEIPVLKQGDNKISFACESLSEGAARMLVTVIGEGAPL